MERVFFTKMCNDRTRDNGFKLEEDGFGLDIREKKNYGEDDEDLIVQRSCGFPIPGYVEGQIRQGFEQPDLIITDFLAQGRGVGLDDL